MVDSEFGTRELKMEDNPPPSNVRIVEAVVSGSPESESVFSPEENKMLLDVVECLLDYDDKGGELEQPHQKVSTTSDHYPRQESLSLSNFPEPPHHYLNSLGVHYYCPNSPSSNSEAYSVPCSPAFGGYDEPLTDYKQEVADDKHLTLDNDNHEDHDQEAPPPRLLIRFTGRKRSVDSGMLLVAEEGRCPSFEPKRKQAKRPAASTGGSSTNRHFDNGNVTETKPEEDQQPCTHFPSSSTEWDHTAASSSSSSLTLARDRSSSISTSSSLRSCGSAASLTSTSTFSNESTASEHVEQYACWTNNFKHSRPEQKMINGVTRRTGSWTAAEDKSLEAAVKKLGVKRWKQVAMQVSGRTHWQCSQRWQKVLQPGLIKGPWTPEEDALLSESVKVNQALVTELRPLSWTAIAAQIQGRTAKQCRERYTLTLDPSISRDPWTEEEDRCIDHMHRSIGNQWAKIRDHLPNRTENQIKSRFKTMMQAKKKDSQTKWTQQLVDKLTALADRFDGDLSKMRRHLPKELKGSSPSALIFYCPQIRQC